VNSDARTEKVFKVFRMMEPQQVAIPLSDLSVELQSASKV
jgi:hypothetical protein